MDSAGTAPSAAARLGLPSVTRPLAVAGGGAGPPLDLNPVSAAAKAAKRAAWKLSDQIRRMDDLTKKARHVHRLSMLEPGSFVKNAPTLEGAVRRPPEEVVPIDMLVLLRRCDVEGPDANPHFYAGGPGVTAAGGPKVVKERILNYLDGCIDSSSAADLDAVLNDAVDSGGITRFAAMAILAAYKVKQSNRQV